MSARTGGDYATPVGYGRMIRRKEKSRPHTIVARERYAWPGGYLLVSIMDDGEVLCPDCTRKNYRSIAWSTRHEANDGWRCIGWDYLANFDEAPICAHCGKSTEEM